MGSTVRKIAAPGMVTSSADEKTGPPRPPRHRRWALLATIEDPRVVEQILTGLSPPTRLPRPSARPRSPDRPRATPPSRSGAQHLARGVWRAASGARDRKST